MTSRHYRVNNKTRQERRERAEKAISKQASNDELIEFAHLIWKTLSEKERKQFLIEDKELIKGYKKHGFNLVEKTFSDAELELKKQKALNYIKLKNGDREI